MAGLPGEYRQLDPLRPPSRPGLGPLARERIGRRKRPALESEAREVALEEVRLERADVCSIQDSCHVDVQCMTPPVGDEETEQAIGAQQPVKVGEYGSKWLDGSEDVVNG